MRNEVATIILVGGRGTRIAHLRADTPKPLVEVNGRPFLDWLTLFLMSYGLSKFVFSSGYKAEQVEAWTVGFEIEKQKHGKLKLEIVREYEPLGTGGAIFASLDHCGEWFIAMNGDSLALFNFGQLTALIGETGIDGALVGLEVDDTSRYGSLDVNENGVLRGFHEKRPGKGLINAGIYLLRKDKILSRKRDGQVSIETEILPELLAQGCCLKVINAGDAPFIDIGTPETLAASDAFVAKHKALFNQPN